MAHFAIQKPSNMCSEEALSLVSKVASEVVLPVSMPFMVLTLARPFHLVSKSFLLKTHAKSSFLTKNQADEGSATLLV